MAHDITSQFYTSLNLPLHDKLVELTRIIDHSAPNKELQALFPHLVNNIFANSFTNGWGLRMITLDSNKYEFEALTSFLEPQGPMFRLCYKLLVDPQLKYNLPLNLLPLNLQLNLERGRCSQFYADMVTMDAQSLNVVALALNPFDYYIFSFALFLINNSQSKSSWENWNSVYFALACDYLMHFLPSDPNVPVLPHIPNYTGKVPMVAPLQTANRPLNSPSLLLIQDLSGMSNQHNQHVSQTQSRNEVWRSETVLQVFIDIWMSVEEFNSRGVDMYQRSYPVMSSPERVRIVRVLVKHLHTFSAKHSSDPASRSSALRKYARQIMCTRAYHYVKHLVTTWPLDASFRLVLELWLSLIQPWRYTDNIINQDRFRTSNNNQEEGNSNTLDDSYTRFIAENFPSYTCIFQLVLPRFLRLDLTAYKNTVMLFRLGKVFSQPHLVPILWNLEQAMTDFNSSLLHSPDTSYNNSIHDQRANKSNEDAVLKMITKIKEYLENGERCVGVFVELKKAFDTVSIPILLARLEKAGVRDVALKCYTYNGIPLHKWVAIAKQAVSEFNLSANFEYDPIWSDNKKPFLMDFIKKILAAKATSDRNLEEFHRKINQQHQGIWASIKHWLMIDNQFEEELILEETKKVPSYLNLSVHHFAAIFLINETSLMPPEPVVEDSVLEHSSFANSSSFPLFITNKLRSPTDVKYMGDPDLMPITSYESTILVRMLHQIATRINEIYRKEFISLWLQNNFRGHVAREVLQPPCTIQTYVRHFTNHQNLVTQELPPRLVLRRLGSHAFVVWVGIGYLLFRFLSYSGFTYAFILFVLWIIFVFTKVSLKMLKILK